MRISPPRLLTSFLFASGLFASTPLSAADGIDIGTRVSLTSKILGEERRLLVHLPESYPTSEFRYPVLYLLDGESDFLHTVGIVDFLSGTEQIPEMIVVGVANTVRSRDLTPESADTVETAFWPAVGGADRFLAFFERELIPLIDESYRTVPYRIIRGQSFGGLLANHDYMGSHPLFNAYLTSSPGVGWNHGSLIERASGFFARGIPRPLYIAAAGRDFPGNLEAIRRFVAAVEEENRGNPSWKFEFFEDERHYSLDHQATYRGLQFLYQGWQIPDDVAAHARFEDYEKHYAGLSEKYGYPIKVPMQTIIRLGNDLLRARRFEDGIRIQKKNLELYPDQPESYWHVGDAYILSGQPEKARTYLKTALDLARAKGVPDVEEYRKSLADLDARIRDTQR